MSIVEVTEQIDAPPERVWQLVGDPVGLGDLTEECVGMTWVGNSAGPSLGARFRGRNRSGWRRWSTSCTIVSYEAGSQIAWDVAFGPFPIARWEYTLRSDGHGGTTISERFEDHRGSAMRATSPLVRGTRDSEGHNRANMASTLARIKARAESR